MKGNFTLDSKFFCVACGEEGIPIARRKGREREPGHLKKLFCLNCHKETNHAEVREFSRYSYEDFLLEFENGNFSEAGDRILSLGEFRNKLHKEGVI